MLIDDIVKNPTKAELPESIEAQRIRVDELAGAVTAQTLRPIFQYILRMHFDVQMLAIKAIFADGDFRMKLLLRLPEYTTWVMEHKETLLKR